MIKFNRKVLIACIFIAIIIPTYFYVRFLFVDDVDKPMKAGTIGFLFSFIVSASALQWADDLESVFKNIKKLDTPPKYWVQDGNPQKEQ